MTPTLRIILASAASAALFSIPLLTLAATPIISFKAASYAPPGYTGKTLPQAGAAVRVALLVVENGRLADLSARTIRWYADGILLASRTGGTSHSLSVPATGQDVVRVRASVPDYDGGGLDAFLDIPVVRPDIAIDRASLPELVPLFYSFSITDPSSLDVVWDDSDPALISLSAKNPANPFEFARMSISR